MRNMKKLIIIPAYNESANIENTVKDIVNNAPDFDYVIINDCSTDNTLEICERNGFNVVNLPLNLGIGGAVQTGYRYAYNNGYDIAVQVDGDGQHDPTFLEKMTETMLAENADMLIGSRFIEKEGFQTSRARRMGITYFSWLIKLFTRKKITDPTSGLRMINSDIIKVFAESYPRDYPEPESVVHVIRLGKNVREIPVIMRERQGGKSSIRFFSSIYYMIKVTVAILTELMRKIDRKKEDA